MKTCIFRASVSCYSVYGLCYVICCSIAILVKSSHVASSDVNTVTSIASFKSADNETMTSSVEGNRASRSSSSTSVSSYDSNNMIHSKSSLFKNTLRFRRDVFHTQFSSQYHHLLKKQKSRRHPSTAKTPEKNQQDLKNNKKRASSVVYSTSSFINNPSSQTNETHVDDSFMDSSVESFLDSIDEITRGVKCPFNSNSKDSDYVFLPKSVKSVAEVPALEWKAKSVSTSNRVSLLSSIMSSYSPRSDDFKLLRNSLDQLVRLDHEFFRARVAWFHPKDPSINSSFNSKSDSKNNDIQTHFFVNLDVKRRFSSEMPNRVISLKEPWMTLSLEGNQLKKKQLNHQLLREGRVFISKESFSREELSFAFWTPVYYSCELKKWLMSFTSFIVSDNEPNSGTNELRLKGVISVDIDISNTDFNQCDLKEEDASHESNQNEAIPVYGTHKCNPETSMVSVLIRTPFNESFTLS